MKILVVCQHYWPEPYPLEDLCEELVRRGHTVHVLTDIPNYPMGIIYPEYRRGRNRRQVHNGVQITRTFTIGRRKNVFFRFLNYYSYAISSTLRALRLKEEYDVVFTNQTSPVMMSSAAIAYAKKHGKRTVMYCMDLWPASLAAGGVGEKSPVYRFFGRVSRKIYGQMDRILISSGLFRDYLREQCDIPDGKITYCPQYAVSGFSREENIPDKDTIDLMFAGNVGKAQCIHTIVQAANLLREHSKLRWHIVGDGSELENLKDLVQKLNLDCVVFHGRKPLEEMPRYYAMADAMLVTLTANPFISLTLPGKVQSYMAAGKPIIAAANGEIQHIIADSGCGYCAAAEDAQGLADAVCLFLKCENRTALGSNARRYYKENFTREKFMDNMESALHAACELEG